MASPVHVGQIIAGKYRVDAIIGQGGMGVVVAATDTSLDRRVAIKFLLAQYALNPMASGRFLREARATARLNSEHAIRIIEVGQLEDGAPFMAMELLNGVDLGSLVEKQGALSMRVAVDYLLQACRGLGDAHQAGIIHRDVKPSNLFLSYQPGAKPLVKVLDFGVSKLNLGVEAGAGALTTTGQTLGSPLYMAPEQMRSSQHVDARSDIWGLGVVLFELLTGARPFAAESLAELVLVINQDPPRDPRTLRPDLPDGICRIIQRCLEKDPSRRYGSVAELALELGPFSSAYRGAIDFRQTTSEPPPTPHVVQVHGGQVHGGQVHGGQVQVGQRGTLLVSGADNVDMAALARMANAVLGPEPGSAVPPVAHAPYGSHNTGVHQGPASYAVPASVSLDPLAARSPDPLAGSMSSAPWASTNDNQKTGARKKKSSGSGIVIGVAALGALVVVGAVAFYLTSDDTEAQTDAEIISAASDLAADLAAPDVSNSAPRGGEGVGREHSATALPTPSHTAIGTPSSAIVPDATSTTPAAVSSPAPSATAPKVPSEPREGRRRGAETPRSAKERLGF